MQSASSIPPAPVPEAIAPAEIERRFRQRFGTAPRLFQAPGRINIIGEHTDYSGGLVMPAAIDRRCLVAAAPNGARRLNVVAGVFGEEASAELDALAPTGGWMDYVAGVASVLIADGVAVAGADLWIESDVPIGAGVSSSAAIEVAVAHALLALAGREADGVQIARWAQRAENDFVGMPCGIMDQFASATGVAGGAMLLDCASLTATPVHLPDAAGFLLVDSMVRHAHVEGEYRARREDCETAARLLGVARLGQVAEADLAAALSRLPPSVARRCRHVVSENGRVRRAAEAIARGDLAGLGQLMNQSHASLSADMQVSTLKVDRLAAIAQAAPGVFGARMMGGGFGGCVIALVDAERAGQATAAIQDAYAGVIGERPDAFVCRAVAGAGEVAA
ncbi:MAG TPA: galactokinase [Caulobacteraceae bacterium]|nr:galactokinase [Caulobacteraceae bacterium]